MSSTPYGCQEVEDTAAHVQPPRLRLTQLRLHRAARRRMSHLGYWPSTINFDWDFFFYSFQIIFPILSLLQIPHSVFTSGKYRSWVYSCSKILQVESHLWGVYIQSFGGGLVGRGPGGTSPGTWAGCGSKRQGPHMPVSLLPTQHIPNIS